MQAAQPAEILRIHISESDRLEGKPLYEAIIARCRELRIAGATVFRGMEGYGETAELHKGHLMTGDRPIVIMVVDAADNIARLIPDVAGMMGTGLMAKSAVQVMRVKKSA